MVPVNFSVSSQGNATWGILATTNTRRRLRKILIAAWRGEEDICQNIFSETYLSSQWFLHIFKWIQRLFSSTRWNCSDTNQQRGRQTRPKHHTYKNHKSKLKTQPEKLLHVSEVTGCCFILSFQELEDSKGFINGIISTWLLDTFAVTLHEGCRVGSLRHEHDECELLKNVASFVQKTQVIVTYFKGKGLNCCAKKRELFNSSGECQFWKKREQ